PLVERLGAGGRRRAGERGAAPLRAVPVKGELRDDEQLAADVLERAGEAARPVVEDTQADDLSAERIGVRLGVLVSDTEEDAEPASDAADEVTAHRDPRLGHALHDGPHGAVKARLANDGEKVQAFRGLEAPGHESGHAEGPS